MIKRLVLAMSIAVASFASFSIGAWNPSPQINVPAAAKACIPEEDELSSPGCPCGCCYDCWGTWVSWCGGCMGY